MRSEITAEELQARLAAALPTYLVDVREPWEVERARLAGSINIPLGELPHRIGEIPEDSGTMVVTVCHHGIRSLHAAGILAAGGRREVQSLAGGVDRWATAIDPTMPRY